MAELPLAGVRILDLSRLLPGPFCSLLLADLGAEVLKVEDTGMGDYVRWTPPYVGDEAAKQAGTASVQFAALNRNKRSIQIDLKNDAGKEILLKLVAGHDVVLESFRPGVLDKLGVGYTRMKAENPGLVYCAISGYGQDGPFRDRAGHDQNYLGLNGLLGLTGAKGGPPVQAAGQIADIGGGAQMAAIAILAALVHKQATGEGAELDISMTDGAMSWLAMPAAAALAGDVRERGDADLGGKWVCYVPYEAADGWVSCGALEPKFWQAFCRGVGREDLIEQQFALVGSDEHAEISKVFRSRTRAEWAAFNDEHDCCIEPVLGIGEALDSELARARGMVIEVDQPGIGPVGQLAPPFVIDGERPGRREPAPAFGEHTDEVLSDLGYSADEIADLRESRVVAGSMTQAVETDGLLRMGELAEASGVPAATIKHYLREGLLPPPVKTSRNMAWYAPEYVDRIKLIKRLQEERYLPLDVIKRILESAPDQIEARLELGDTLLARSQQITSGRGITRKQAVKKLGLPEDVLDGFERIGAIEPQGSGSNVRYSQPDAEFLAAISDFRRSGYGEALGFTIYDALIYMRHLEALARDEVDVITEKLPGRLSADEAADLIERGHGPMRDLLSAMHVKLLIAELRRRQDG